VLGLDGGEIDVLGLEWLLLEDVLDPPDRLYWASAAVKDPNTTAAAVARINSLRLVLKEFSLCS
jgi:hypothetical protein